MNLGRVISTYVFFGRSQKTISMLWQIYICREYSEQEIGGRLLIPSSTLYKLLMLLISGVELTHTLCHWLNVYENQFVEFKVTICLLRSYHIHILLPKWKKYLANKEDTILNLDYLSNQFITNPLDHQSCGHLQKK